MEGFRKETDTEIDDSRQHHLFSPLTTGSFGHNQSVSLNNTFQDFLSFDNPKSNAPLFAIGVRPKMPTLFYDIDVSDLLENDIVTEELDIMYKNFLIPKLVFNDDAVKEIRESNSVFERMQEFFKYKERTWFYAGLNHYHWAIYQTKHGWHMVMPMPTWDRVQFSLYELKVIFPKSTYSIYTKNLRLRISPKWDIVTGKEVSPRPTLFDACPCYQESRIGNKESYRTYD